VIGILGEILPLLVSIAIHPIAIAVALVIAGRPGGAKGGSMYCGGFAAGIITAFGITRLLASGHFGHGGHGARMNLAKLDLVAGVVVILWALWSVTFGRKMTEDGYVGNIIRKALPMSDGQLLFKGFKGALLNPKDLAVSVALGAHLGYLDPGPLQEIAVLAIFVFVGILPLLIPAIVAWRGSTPQKSLLYLLTEWINHHLPLASSLVLVVMGLNMIRSAAPHLR
jgi:hypothetical protein